MVYFSYPKIENELHSDIQFTAPNSAFNFRVDKMRPVSPLRATLKQESSANANVKRATAVHVGL